MNRKVFLLSAVWLCATMAGPVLADNAERQPVAKPVSFTSKALKGFGKVRNERAMQLRTGEADAANLSLRSTLEPGHNRPDSAIYYGFYDNEQHPVAKRIFTYEGDVIKETVYELKRESVEWSNNVLYEEEYAFDAYGNQTLSIYWWYSEGKLYSASKYEFAYNPNGTPLYEKSYRWKNGEWILYFEIIYQYDASGVMTGGTFYNSNMEEAVIPLTVSGTPENLEVSITINGSLYMKTVLHFDPVTMKLLGSEYFEMNEDTGVLESKGVNEYTYDAAGRVLTELFHWHYGSVEKTEYVYDAAGRKLFINKSAAKNIASPFVVHHKTEYEYDGDRLERIKIYYSNLYQDGSIPDLDSALHEITVFYYSGATGNEQATLTEVSVYPNPVTDVLTVSGVQAGATLTIISLSGSTVVRKTLADTETTLSVSSLPSGLYFVTVRSGKGTATFKIIKK